MPKRQKPPAPEIKYKDGFHNIPVYRSLHIHRLQLQHVVDHFYGLQSILDKLRAELISSENLRKWKQ